MRGESGVAGERRVVGSICRSFGSAIGWSTSLPLHLYYNYIVTRVT